MNNEQLLEEIHIVKNHSDCTKLVYKQAVGKYTAFCEKSMEELLEEAEDEEDKGVRWKKRTLKRRLLSFRQYLIDNYSLNTAKSLFQPILVIYKYFEIEVFELPKINRKSVKVAKPIEFKDLPDKKIIRNALKIATPIMRAIILFMVSSGCARRETLNLTIGDYIDALSEYTTKNDIYDILSEIDSSKDIIPTFNVLRQKTNKYYTTYCSPEAVQAINIYLLSREDRLTNDSPLFKIEQIYFNTSFKKINDELGLGNRGIYARFRSHMLRKFHASALYNDGMSLDKVNDLQGKAKNKTDAAYFMTNPEDLKYEYIKHLHAVTINKEVEKLSIKSPEFITMERENEKYKQTIDKLTNDIASIMSRLDEEAK
ncbi:MAG: tyrosine-type recombinase/integrase [Methanobrevibacter sp.]|uniref:tyrosine-type recombinase/integrase n=1 Tax=Methanobrevibacter sp. TaxID=66852 RepID=UPI002E795BA0|nr:tyrosine-type recombinase/integrase [Methanobrevibacter sp.]MEE0934899.1 tyrosine-type recombinase/integrase [Methanobrevibacter sp.]